LCRKPLTGTVAQNVQEHGTGALNIDASRVDPTGESKERVNEPSQGTRYTNQGAVNIAALPGVRGGAPTGRFPANLIHDGSDEVVALFPTAPGQMAKASTSDTQRAGQNTYGRMVRGSNGQEPRGDKGSAARFFKSCPDDDTEDHAAARLVYCAKASKQDRGDGNRHPTVKATTLMRYLCRLITPPDGVVLDPFMGSGSTGKAAMLEDFRFIGIESEPEYFEIAQARITDAARQSVQRSPETPRAALGQ